MVGVDGAVVAGVTGAVVVVVVVVVVGADRAPAAETGRARNAAATTRTAATRRRRSARLRLHDPPTVPPSCGLSESGRREFPGQGNPGGDRATESGGVASGRARVVERQTRAA